MARYKLTAAAIIDDVRHDIGSEIEFDGVPGPHMEPLDAPAKRAVAERDKQQQPAVDPGMRAHPEEATRPGAAPPAPPATEEKKEEKPEDRVGPGGTRRG